MEILLKININNLKLKVASLLKQTNLIGKYVYTHYPSTCLEGSKNNVQQLKYILKYYRYKQNFEL